MLEGSKKWPNAKAITKLGQIRAGLSGPEIKEIFERIADAISETRPELSRYFINANPDIGQKIAAAWEDGMSQSLGLG
jgi:2-oxo-4-hydroxy-4-carboxy--5-ureidoimidazoline (OHCU) decarboxylase